LKNGNMSVRSNQKGSLTSLIGADQKTAVRDLEVRLHALEQEYQKAKRDQADVAALQKKLKLEWNNLNKEWKQVSLDSGELEKEIKVLTTEAEEDSDGEDDEDTTTHLVTAVRDRQDDIEETNKEITSLESQIDLEGPKARELENKLEEENSRNEKVLAECEEAENDLKRYSHNVEKYAEKIEKYKRTMVDASHQYESELQKYDTQKKECEEKEKQARTFTWRVLDRRKKKEGSKKKKSAKNGGKRKKRDDDDDDDDDDEEEEEEVNKNDDASMSNGDDDDDDEEDAEPTDEELQAITFIRATKERAYYDTKIKQAVEKVDKERKKRKISEVDPLVVQEKWARAKNNLAEKMLAVEKTKDNVELLQKDLGLRRKKWKALRKHIAKMTNNTFDTMLQKKGSAGSVDFDHANRQLSLTVQKDANEASQTSDVKALSGGERSFTTLSLLLALGEQLETPFRVMDEFDVFLDAVARKIALDTLVTTAQAMNHRQFIFITPQDLSQLVPSNTLKIIKMKPPVRGGQTTID